MSEVKDKYDDGEEEFFIDEPKKPLAQQIRQDFELFDDEKYIPGKMLSVKRVALPNNGENWEVYQDDNCLLVLTGVRFTKPERSFLRTVDGVKFIITGCKEGWGSVSEFKRNIKKWIK